MTAAIWNAQTMQAGQLFAPSSPWNVLAKGTVDPNSDTMIATLAQAMGTKGLDVQTSQWTVPLWYADESTPRVKVKASTSWWAGFAGCPIPKEAKPDPAGDAHMAVWDVPNRTLYEFWKAVKKNGIWRAGYGVTFQAKWFGYQDGAWLNSARAYGGSLVGGLIRYGEIQAGVIHHALALAYPLTRGDAYARGMVDGGMAIASHCDNNRSPNRITDANIPEGARLRLKASVDVAARAGSNRAALVIGTALQTYGAYVVDTAGAPVLYAENLIGKKVTWSGLLSVLDARMWKASDFEVLALPELTRAP